MGITKTDILRTVAIDMPNVKTQLDSIVSKNKKLKDKKWCVLGDSITDVTYHSDKNYWHFVRDRNECIIYPHGKNGKTIIELIAEVNNCELDSDIISLFAGTNDWHIGTQPLGTFLDVGIATVAGGINEMLKSLISKFGNKTILVFSPLPRYAGGQYGLACGKNNREYTLLDLVDMLKKTCNHYSIPFYDLYRECGFHMGFDISRNEYFTDGLHPNIKGHEQLSYIFEDFICEHMKMIKSSINPDIVNVTGISLNKSTFTMSANSKVKLLPYITPSNATNKSITWISSNPNVATVDQNGNVSAISQGSANISAITVNGGFVSNCSLTVNNNSSYINLTADKIRNIDGFTGLNLDSSRNITYDTAKTWSGILIEGVNKIKFNCCFNNNSQYKNLGWIIYSANGNDTYNVVQLYSTPSESGLNYTMNIPGEGIIVGNKINLPTVNENDLIEVSILPNDKVQISINGTSVAQINGYTIGFAGSVEFTSKILAKNVMYM